MPSLKIIPFEPQYARNFLDLNTIWIEKYFHVEQKDKELLEDCEKNIINKGGFIFFAKYDETIVGCFCFIKLTDKCFELGKMAVDENYQGLKIGQKLLNYAIEHAKAHNWKQIILYTSAKLPIAQHIYKKAGFNEVVIGDNLDYARSELKMELNL
ncbi:GNAT family N-acetyltransferase [Aurantibacter crassamenti]|uniref:GNAT family N-acetyltransferase n=1 Tax=Aurantibacter crassamenti TaxID=1837375 RepID=UPI0019395C29|nr:GNAT family N-acetyltransferase [Aurantibacter crassamenti]MBM1107407.1 GNAT family N-acetyltransferase [Aurantibacter crassamenti]